MKYRITYYYFFCFWKNKIQPIIDGEQPEITMLGDDASTTAKYHNTIGIEEDGGLMGNADTTPNGGIPDEMLIPDPITYEERDMDRMFDADNYPTIEEIDNAIEPEVGMEFESRDATFHFFALYARKMGFAVKKHTTRTSNRTGMLEKQLFVCNRSGKNEINETTARKRRSNVVEKTYCKVQMTVKYESGRWVVKTLDLDHNHTLAPSKWLVRFMKCHKLMNEQEKNIHKNTTTE